MKTASLKVDLREFRKRIEKAGKKIKAAQFKGVLQATLKRTLGDAIKLTPARDKKKIKKAQTVEYQKRINFIDSYHERKNPPSTGFLSVSENGDEWLFFGGKWYRGEWRLPPDAFATLEYLRLERQRRMQLDFADFLENRLQARFLFRRQWFDIGVSAGAAPRTSPQTRHSHPRNRNRPPPPKAYAQWRGGGFTLSVTLTAPLLTATSSGGNSPLSTAQFRDFDARDIFAKAFKMNEENFNKQIKTRLTKLLK